MRIQQIDSMTGEHCVFDLDVARDALDDIFEAWVAMEREISGVTGNILLVAGASYANHHTLHIAITDGSYTISVVAIAYRGT